MSGNPDWEAVRRRLGSLEDGLDSTARRSEERTQRVLRERARLLARTPAEPALEDTIALATFDLDGEVAGIDVAAVVEICRFTQVAVVPGARPPVHGVAGWRGELLTLLDVRRAVPPTSGAEAAQWAVVLQAGERRFGLLIGEIHGLAGVPRNALQPPAPRAPDYVHAVTPEPMIVLDAGQLVRLYE